MHRLAVPINETGPLVNYDVVHICIHLTVGFLQIFHGIRRGYANQTWQNVATRSSSRKNILQLPASVCGGLYGQYVAPWPRDRNHRITMTDSNPSISVRNRCRDTGSIFITRVLVCQLNIPMAASSCCITLLLVYLLCFRATVTSKMQCILLASIPPVRFYAKT